MTNWVLVDNLINLRNQINAFAPNRDHTSDGTIGDTAHQAELSGHNPDDTKGSKADYNDGDGIAEVRAFDCDIDFKNGVTAQQVVDHIRKLSRLDSVMRYMIYDRKMYHVRDNFAATPYTGSSAHTEHIHFESAWAQSADNNSSFNYGLGSLVAKKHGYVDLSGYTAPILITGDDDRDYDGYWDVSRAQKLLSITPDGVYGPKTVAAVKSLIGGDGKVISLAAWIKLFGLSKK